MSERPSARLVSASPRTWRTYAEVADICRGPGDPEWDADRDRIDHTGAKTAAVERTAT